MVLGREKCVLILDDTEGVWPRHRDNLVQIERYLYFPADAGRFGFRWDTGRVGCHGCRVAMPMLNVRLHIVLPGAMMHVAAGASHC